MNAIETTETAVAVSNIKSLKDGYLRTWEATINGRTFSVDATVPYLHDINEDDEIDGIDRNAGTASFTVRISAGEQLVEWQSLLTVRTSFANGYEVEVCPGREFDPNDDDYDDVRDEIDMADIQAVADDAGERVCVAFGENTAGYVDTSAAGVWAEGEEAYVLLSSRVDGVDRLDDYVELVTSRAHMLTAYAVKPRDGRPDLDLKGMLVAAGLAADEDGEPIAFETVDEMEDGLDKLLQAIEEATGE